MSSSEKIGIIGLGAIGKELAKRTPLLGMETYVFDVSPDSDFISANNLIASESIKDVLKTCDIVSLHVPLLESTKGLLSKKLLQEITKPGLVLVNTSRAGLVEEQDILDAINSGKLGGYLTDVLSVEPMDEFCLIRNHPKVLITPHIGSRTMETIQKQGSKAVENLINSINESQSGN